MGPRGTDARTAGGPVARSREDRAGGESYGAEAAASRSRSGVSRTLVLFTPGHAEPGGAARRSRLIARQLASRGWHVAAITRAGTLRRPRLDRERNLAVIEIPGFGRRRLGGLLYMLIALPTGLILGLRARAFLSVQLMSTSTVAALCARLMRRPLIAMSTTSGELGELRYLRTTRSWPLRRRLLARAAALIAQTPAMIAELSELVPEDRITVLPNPVEVPHAPAALDGNARVLFAGRLSAEKGLDTLLDAWAPIGASVPDAKLTIAGAGGEYRSVEAELRRRVAEDPLLRSSVTFTGWIEEIGATIVSCDLFVLPSREEGMSNALLEACAAGRIVIASDIPPNRAVLGEDYPLLFPPGDAGSLEAQLRRALRDEDGVRAEARSRVAERIREFSSDSVIARLEDLIDAANRARH